MKRKAQHPAGAQGRRKPPAPKADAPNALSVSDGTISTGTIVEHNGAHFAFGIDQKLIGRFNSRTEAMRAIPSVVAAADDDGLSGLDLATGTGGLPRSISAPSVGISKSVGTSKVSR
jgi:hypothetical protein